MPPSSAATFGELLREHRLAAGLTQEALAERAGLSVYGIQKLERGVTHPYRDTAQRLLVALQLAPADEARLRATIRPLPRRGTAGPPGRAGAARHNLPMPISSFVGREQELGEVTRQLAGARLLTLTGVGGCGKTRLALEVARAVLGRYPDGVWLVELGPLADPGLVLHRVGAVLGVHETAEQPITRAVARVVSSRRVLLVLDNCEHLLDASAALVDTLLRACPELRILATSRAALGITGEVAWRVPSLSVPEPGAALSMADLARNPAVQLFSTRATAAQAGFALTVRNAAAVAQICRHLDGLPLALELAAARIEALTAEQLAARLDQGFRLLTGGSRAAPPRQQTLEATLNWSYDLLSGAEQRLFERLSVFAGGWTLEAAEAIGAGGGLAPEEVLDLLAGLVRKSLVVAEEQVDGTERYHLLETVREYATQRLAARDPVEAAAARAGHAAYYLHLAEAAEPELKRLDQAAWFERHERDHDNFRAVLRWSLAEGNLEVGLRLATALQRFWEVRGHWSEARRWLVDLLGAPGTAAQSTHLRAAAVAHAGYFAFLLGDHVAGRHMSNEGLYLARTIGAQATAAFALHSLGQLMLDENDPAAARPLEESLALARQLEDGWATARVLSNLSSVALEAGDIEVARSLAEEGVAIARQAGERRIESTILINLASLQVGDLAAAYAYLEDALAIKRELGDRHGVGRALHGLGWVAFDHGEYLAACQRFCEALRIARDLGVADRPSLDRPSTLAGLACVALQLGDVERALRLFAADARIAEAGGFHYAAYLSERRRRLLEAARERLGMAAERVWNEGWALTLDDLDTEVSALAVAAERARLAV